jgi:hypothetical protein
MNNKFIIKYNNSLWVLIFYYAALVVIVGRTYTQGLEDAVAIIFVLYGLPLSVFLVLYVVIMANAVYGRVRHQVELQRILIPVTIKAMLATFPLFFLDNRLANILYYLNHW